MPVMRVFSPGMATASEASVMLESCRTRSSNSASSTSNISLSYAKWRPNRICLTGNSASSSFMIKRRLAARPLSRADDFGKILNIGLELGPKLGSYNVVRLQLEFLIFAAYPFHRNTFAQLGCQDALSFLGKNPVGEQ